MDAQFSPQLTDALKWVAIVFAAGFIGYFGRHLGKIVITRFHTGRTIEPPTTPPTKEIKNEQGYTTERYKLKLEKKRLKLEKKKQKEKDD
jgi:hypothetical protein